MHRDDLTGLPADPALRTALSERASAGAPFSVAVLDPDRLARVNESAGLPEGDEALRAVAGRLQAAVGGEEFLARWGAGFALALDAGLEEAAARVDGMRQDLVDAPLEVHGLPVALTASAGVAAFPADGSTAGELLAVAGAALADAKRHGRNRVVVSTKLEAAAKGAAAASAYLPCAVLAGRKRERALAAPILEAAKERRRAALLVIGEAGSGKTRFLREMAARADELGILWALDAPAAGGVAGAALRLVNRFYGRGAAARDALKAALSESQRAGLRELAPAFASWPAARSPVRRTSRLRAIEAALAAIARARPVLVLLDEVADADAETLAALDAAGVAVAASVTGGLDPSKDGAAIDFLRRRDVQSVRLAPLSDGEMKAVLDAVLPGAKRPPAFDGALLKACRGSPRLLEGALRGLAAAGRVRREGRAWKLEASADDILAALPAVGSARPAFDTNAGTLAESTPLEAIPAEAEAEEGAPAPDAPAPAPPAPPPPPEPVELATAFLAAFTAAVERARLYPQWSDAGALAETRRAAVALAGAIPLASFAIESSGLRFNGSPVESERAVPAAWEFSRLLSERLISRLVLQQGLDEREVEALAREMARPAEASRMPPDFWAGFLEREGIAHLAIAQRAFVPESESESVVLQRGELFGETPIGPDLQPSLVAAMGALRCAAEALRANPPESPGVEMALKLAEEAVPRLLARVRLVTLESRDGALLVNRQPAEPDETARFFAAQMREKGFTTLTLKDGVTAREIRALASALSVPSGQPELVQSILKSTQIRRFFLARPPDRTAPPPPAPEPPAPPEVKETKEERGTRLRALLDADPQAFLGGPATVKAMQDAPARERAALVERLAQCLAEESPVVRQQALGLARRALRELKAEALGAFLEATVPAMKARLLVESDPAVQPTLVETLRLWMAVALLTRRVDDAALLVKEGLRPVLDSAKTPSEYRLALLSKLRAVGQEASAPLLHFVVNGPVEEREFSLVVLGVVGAPVASHLVKLVMESNKPDVRKGAARALGLIGSGADELAAAVAGGDPEVARRVLGVLELAGPGAVAAAVRAGFSQSSALVQSAALDLVSRLTPGMAAAALRPLLAGGDPLLVRHSLAAATKLKLAEVGQEVAKIASSTSDEELAKVCLGYFKAAPTPSAVPALRRVFEMRSKMLGLKKGWSDETRAMAVEAAALVKGEAARELLEAARSDSSEKVKMAAPEPKKKK